MMISYTGEHPQTLRTFSRTHGFVARRGHGLTHTNIAGRGGHFARNQAQPAVRARIGRSLHFGRSKSPAPDEMKQELLQ